VKQLTGRILFGALALGALVIAAIFPSPLIEQAEPSLTIYRIEAGTQFVPIEGEPGPPGEQGEPGPEGECGPVGPAGEPGADGEPGEPGETGPQGEQGEQGETGATGATGATGSTGATGATGATGPQGEPGECGPQGEPGPIGPAGITTLGDYGSFYHNPSVAPAGAHLATLFPLGSTTTSRGISVVDGSKITVSRDGVYNIQFSAQLYKGADNKADAIDIWLTKNGANLPSTNTRISLDKNVFFQVAAWNFVQEALAGDYFQLVFSSNDETVVISGIEPQTNPDRPAVPSIIVTVTQVG
jgi:hypothetical protein